MQNKTVTKYLNPKNARNFEAKRRRFREKRDLKITLVDNGTIVVDRNTWAFGVFNDRHRFVRQSKCMWGNNCQFRPRANFDDVDYMDCDAVFCGGVIAHFGDGLLNGTPRIWAALPPPHTHTRAPQPKRLKYVFVYRDGMQVPEFYRVLLRGLGVRDADIIVLTRTTRFRRIIIPDQAFNVWYWSSDMFRQTYNAISDYYKKHVDVPHYDKIYVSRGAMPLRRPFGEQQLENIFRKNGFAIIYPETLPLPEQIALMSHCQVLAGAAGTALHLSLFMPNGGSVIWLKRNSDPRNDNAGLQHMLCSSFDMSLYLIEGSIEQRPTGHFTNCPQIMGVNKYVRAFLDDHGFKYTASDIAFDAAEWARYESARAEYESTSGTEATSKLKKRFIKILACFVIGRVNRNRFRKWLQNKLQ